MTLLCYLGDFIESYGTVSVGTVAALIAYRAMLTNRLLAENKNTLDFQKDYESSTAIDNYWKEFRKLARGESDITFAQAAFPEHYAHPGSEAVREILNRWEAVAAGIRHKVYNETMLYENYGGVLLKIWAYSLPYVRALQRQPGNERAYIQVEKLVANWQERRRQEDRRNNANS